MIVFVSFASSGPSRGWVLHRKQFLWKSSKIMNRSWLFHCCNESSFGFPMCGNTKDRIWALYFFSYFTETRYKFIFFQLHSWDYRAPRTVPAFYWCCRMIELFYLNFDISLLFLQMAILPCFLKMFFCPSQFLLKSYYYNSINPLI